MFCDPIFIKLPAKITDAAVGASTCASGNQRCRAIAHRFWRHSDFLAEKVEMKHYYFMYAVEICGYLVEKRRYDERVNDLRDEWKLPNLSLDVKERCCAKLLNGLRVKLSRVRACIVEKVLLEPASLRSCLHVLPRRNHDTWFLVAILWDDADSVGMIIKRGRRANQPFYCVSTRVCRRAAMVDP